MDMTDEAIQQAAYFEAILMKPSRRDMSDAKLALETFPGAYGSASDFFGQGFSRPDPRRLWMYWKVSCAYMSTLWSALAPDSDPSDYETMLGADDTYRFLTINFFKMRQKLFRPVWVGNLALQFDALSQPIGSISGRSQADMWLAYRQVVRLDCGRVHQTTTGALRAA